MASFEPERWRILSPYLDEALALADGEARAAWLRALGSRDAGIAADLAALLAEHRAAVEERFLEQAPIAPPVGGGPAAGQAVGAYTLVSPIGQGGMGTVWLAERSDGRFERRAAVKFLRIALGGRGEERFRREGSILARLVHPHVAQLLDAGVTPSGQPYLVIEYVDGEPIDRYCDGRAVDVRTRVRLLLDVLDAVAHAHASLIVHRDLKPSNILVDRSGTPKLLDFGIARIVDLAAEQAWTGERLLTPGYASPEQVRGLPPATGSDIYSLGAILYRLLTGRAPHAVEDATPMELEAVVCAVEPPAPRRVNPALPVDLDCIVRKALRKESAERYTSVEALAEDLRAFLESRPVRARSGNAWYRTRRFVRRYWAPVGATVLVIGSLSIGLFVAERARLIADRRFNQLRRLATNVLALDRPVQRLPGSTEVRRRLVSISLQYLEGLAADARGDLGLMRDLGEAYWRIAHVQGVPTDPNLGQSQAADASLAKADALIEQVLAARPSDRSALLRSASIAHDRMILAQSDDRDAVALAYARTAEARIERLLRAGGLAADARGDVAGMYGNIALALINMHRYGEAIPDARHSVDLARRSPPNLSRISGGLSLLANALRYEGRLDEALRAIEEARAVQDRITYRSPVSRMFALYGVLMREGYILGEAGGVNLGRPADAIATIQQALDLTEAAARADPNDSTSRARVGTAGRQLGNLLRERDPTRALAAYDIAIRRLREIPDNARARRDEARTLAESAYALRALGRRAEAGRRVGTALALLKATGDYPAAHVLLDSAVCTVLRAQADEQAGEGDLLKAAGDYLRLIGAVMASASKPFDDLRDAAALSPLYHALAGLYRRMGIRVAAVEVNARERGLWRSWNRRLPGNTFVLREIAAASGPVTPRHPPGG